MGGAQLELSFKRGHGGARAGAGRKQLPAHERRTPHRARAVHRAAHPLHVTLRAASRSLRSRFVSQTVLHALRDSNSAEFRLTHYSIQDSHVHLIVEAASTAALSSGMRGLMVRVARRVNRVLFRRGRFWADRWYGRALTGPRQVRNALVYVLQNRLSKRAAPPPHPCRSIRFLRQSGFTVLPLGYPQAFAASAHPASCPRKLGCSRSGGFAMGELASGKLRRAEQA
jgi:REP element-mobilizing transposase RayT